MKNVEIYKSNYIKEISFFDKLTFGWYPWTWTWKDWLWFHDKKRKTWHLYLGRIAIHWAAAGEPRG